MGAVRETHATSAARGKIYAFGGVTDGYRVIASVEYYDSEKNIWIPTTSLPAAIRYHGKSDKDKIYRILYKYSIL